ncbi:hypothetical protein [Deinococcus sonorensis]|uniref:Uncharacterized protein n=1 Tax=Deinococcus sonorensis TaxID=309891 RepID=A0ABV8YE70_9DEIO
MNDELHTPPAPSAARSAPAKPKDDASAPLRLSVLLEQVPPEHRAAVTTRVYEQVKDGKLPGVKLTTRAPLQVSWVRRDGKPSTLTTPEVLLRPTPDVRERFGTLVAEVAQELLLQAGAKGLTADRIDELSGDQFEKLLAQQARQRKKRR